METEKPKRKRKSGEGRPLLWFTGGALVLLGVLLAGAFLYWRANPAPAAPEYEFTPVPTEIPFVLPEQCSITGTYQMTIGRPSTPVSDAIRSIPSPNNTYQAVYKPDGVFIVTVDSSAEPV